jgi:DNA invertase Pin-like site-specific DNA recombinase
VRDFRANRIESNERTLAGLERARVQGRVGGRPKTEDNPKITNALLRLRERGKSIRQIAAELSLSTNTVLKVLRQAA